ncbi:MAG: hypothetical protein KID05_09830 [Pseudomonas sp.]|uniref:hypothetical protein n=1 Tax=Pseudomonas sp. TaxID=306 RepID=UPI0023563693|nr:hypothetical protein [Pseudomonas sp.]MBS5839453.1 hypothetical protein [Pseudomonas sp.]
MRMLVAWLALLVLAGCSDESKMKSACEGLVKALAVDPGSVKVNEISVIRGNISQRDLETAYSRRFGGAAVSPETKRYYSGIYEKGSDLPIKYWVDVDYTANESLGNARSSMLCSYISIVGGDLFLSSLSTGKREYQGYGLDALFMGKSLPSNLDSSFSIK